MQGNLFPIWNSAECTRNFSVDIVCAIVNCDLGTDALQDIRMFTGRAQPLCRSQYLVRSLRQFGARCPRPIFGGATCTRRARDGRQLRSALAPGNWTLRLLPRVPSDESAPESHRRSRHCGIDGATVLIVRFAGAAGRSMACARSHMGILGGGSRVRTKFTASKTNCPCYPIFTPSFLPPHASARTARSIRLTSKQVTRPPRARSRRRGMSSLMATTCRNAGTSATCSRLSKPDLARD